ncbi:MAG: hypothetical protein EPN45_13195 [Rhizobiaceae bacterium]|jgi:hypothetical protein|nr:MAG: hypothetical protein EPN45_13195 [Rhizobiaceae bacterium]
MSRVHARYARCAHEHESDLIGIVLRTAKGEQTLVLPLADIERMAADARSRLEKDRETDRLLAEIEDLSKRMLADVDDRDGA